MGQPDNVANVVLEWAPFRLGTNLRVLYNASSRASRSWPAISPPTPPGPPTRFTPSPACTSWTAGATLTIEPGTIIHGGQVGGTLGALTISRGSKIVADGTAAQPIIFTSDQKIGERNRADWGGLIINGRGPMNDPAGERLGEGDTGTYGGGDSPDPHDSSGVLHYVRVEFAGTRITTENELNGIAFQGVGDGTVIDYIQVIYNQDDEVEFFGGAADAKHLLFLGGGDDMLDWTLGWQGKLQFAVAVQEGQVRADQGFECDNLGSDNLATPIANPMI